MKNEIVLWGIAKGETEAWKEQVLYTKATNMNDIDKVRAIAAKDGWHSFRVSVIDLSQEPNFKECIN